MCSNSLMQYTLWLGDSEFFKCLNDSKTLFMIENSVTIVKINSTYLLSSQRYEQRDVIMD